MAINFDAQVRLTEALLELLRASAPRRDRQRLLDRGTRRARRLGRLQRVEVRARGVVGRPVGRGARTRRPRRPRAARLHRDRGFPAIGADGEAVDALGRLDARPRAEAIFQAGIERRAERYVPRPYAIAAALRVLAPALVRRVLGGGAATVMTTTTGPDAAERRNGSTPHDG